MMRDVSLLRSQCSGGKTHTDRAAGDSANMMNQPSSTERVEHLMCQAMRAGDDGHNDEPGRKKCTPTRALQPSPSVLDCWLNGSMFTPDACYLASPPITSRAQPRVLVRFQVEFAADHH